MEVQEINRLKRLVDDKEEQLKQLETERIKNETARDMIEKSWKQEYNFSDLNSIKNKLNELEDLNRQNEEELNILLKEIDSVVNWDELK